MIDVPAAVLDSLHGLAFGDAFGDRWFGVRHRRPGRLALRFAAAYADDTHRGYGSPMHDVLRRIGAGEPWQEVVTGQRRPPWSLEVTGQGSRIRNGGVRARRSASPGWRRRWSATG
ncbi:hypothetical protein GCM10010276_32070 [Streptomyces longisporus]|uniref:Uncharacterized protein n=1 Tax=Streptomyces longisporus TaxID=1948 RepID=A0ABN3LUP6_STRLO